MTKFSTHAENAANGAGVVSAVNVDDTIGLNNINSQDNSSICVTLTVGQDQCNFNLLNKIESIRLQEDSTLTIGQSHNNDNSITTLKNGVAVIEGTIYSENNNSGHIIIKEGIITIKGAIGSESSHISSMKVGSPNTANSAAIVNLASPIKYYINDVYIYSDSRLNFTKGAEIIGKIHEICNEDGSTGLIGEYFADLA
ncbi:MAG: hypothetical protein EKK61_01355 [Rickettsiales bacterium]|nr:MAG: hypothetical protein EKK61_01355 [Rickettsiales bacterium]